MPVRRPHRSRWNFLNSRKRNIDQNDRNTRRRSLLEPLEQRQLLAVGPQLAGIQLNDGDLLREGSVRQISPSELVFSFNDGATIDPSTLSGIRLTRSGGDGLFSAATATSDFNTGGQVVVDFTAVDSGESGNNISISVIKNPTPTSPLVSVLSNAISVELNSTTGTTAGELVDAINNHPAASKLLTASIRRGAGSVNLTTPEINYSPIVTGGANAASIVTNLTIGNSVEVNLIANTAGPAGFGTEVSVVRTDFGGVAPPRVTVTDQLIRVEVNSNVASPTTLGEFVDAINGDAAASNLITATLNVGDRDLVIGNRVGALRLPLTIVADIPIEPGFIGLGETPRQVVMRFAEPLPDDLYHVEIIGSGPFALRNTAGAAFQDTTDDAVDDGSGFGLDFELDLGAQVLAVVPQPVLVNEISNIRSQFRDRINVYFNDDDLFPTATVTGREATDPTVVSPDFYQLIFTNDTVQNTDDVIYHPSLIDYDPAADLAVLVFDEPLDQLGSGSGTFRLRIGTDEAMPLAPLSSTAVNPTATIDFGTQGAESITLTARQDFATRVTVEITKRDFGAAGNPIVSVTGQKISLELNTNAGNETTANDVISALRGSSETLQLVDVLDLTSGTGTTDIATTAVVGTVVLEGVGSSFDTASQLGTLAGQSQSLVLSSSIDPQAFELDFPGDEAEPGHRDLRPEVQRHFLTGFDADGRDGITTAFYNFEDEIGFDPQGNIIRNQITETQKQRAREIFSIYASQLGIDFVETTNLGITVATGDLRAISSEVANGPGGVIGLACPSTPIPDGFGGYGCAAGNNGLLDGIAIMDLQDFSDIGADAFGNSWFLTAMHEIGHVLGLGHTDELPSLTSLNGQLSVPGSFTGNPLDFPENTVEPVFPGSHDIAHGQHLYRPDGKDIDMFSFQLPENGRLSVETFAERLQETSRLDTVVSLYRQNANGNRELIARNDDYYSNDSYIELDLSAGTYWVGVSASGNDKFDPSIDDTGLGGTTEGAYDLRLNFRPSADNTIVDATGVSLDGDADGVPGGVFNTWFRATDASRNIFVDKGAQTAGNGTLAAPFQLISNALASAQPGDVVRILANGGADRNVATPEDNRAYEIGFNRLGAPLADGTTLNVPKGVTVVVDAGAVIKLRRARIGVGSSSVNVDRSAGALQILGTPVLLDPFNQVIRDAAGDPVSGSVFLTSIHDDEIGADTNPDAFPPEAAPGDWGGIAFRNDLDNQDANRFNYDRQGIFLNVVSNADIRYGGGTALINGIPETITPIHITGTRPTIAFNDISLSADAAVSASPNSFEETNFESPEFQFTPFTSDYDRVGPDLRGNTALNNSVNGLFVRVTTPAGNSLQPLTVSARFDDTDLPYVLADQLLVQGTPGGHILEIDSPTVQLVTTTAVDGGTLADGTYNYRVVFVDADGNEGAPSSPTADVTISAATTQRAVQLENLPTATSGFITRRIYRSDATGNASGTYVLVGEINITSTSFTDSGGSLGRQLNPINAGGTFRARLDARLAIDPGVVVKLNGGGIEATLGGDFYAEGVDGREIVFTSVNDDRYGGGGTFDTTSNAMQALAQPGDWGGLVGGHISNFSLDNSVVAYGGGVIDIEGSFAGFNAVELQQSNGRVTNSLLENNDAGTGGRARFDRVGRGFNRPATIFVRGAQPVIVGNDIINNSGPVISIDANSLNADSLRDTGRSTYGTADLALPIDRLTVGIDNRGPLIRLNRIDFNDVNGMQVRGGTLTEEGVWDDTDIVHVLRDESVNVSDFHTSGGLRLQSSATESLVVKLDGASAGFTATGLPLDINDRIGGAVQVVGQPSHPVVLTSIFDCTVGAGFTPDGLPNNDTLNSNACGGEVLSAAPFVDFIVVIDESGTMANSQQFMKTLITDLEAALVARGVGDGTFGVNEYGLVGFGGSSFGIPDELVGHSHQVGGMLTGTAADFVVAVDTLNTNGGFEDGYSGIQFAIDNYQYRPEAEKFILLVTDEDRDIADPSLTFNSILTELNAADITLEGILEVDIRDTGQNLAIGADSIGNAFLEDGAGGFTVAPLGSISSQFGFFGFDTTISDYADLVFATNGVVGDIGPIASPFVAGNLTATSFSNVLVSQIAAQAGAGGRGTPGDWSSVTLDEYSHDRNVETVVEIESADLAAPGSNATPQNGEPLGRLAPHEKAGDENLRLGFEIHGSLTARQDIDVYSFNGQPGTEVWFDIDATQGSLDSVVELIDATGTVLARSDNSLAEAADPSLLIRSNTMSSTSANPLSKRGYDPLNPSATSSLAIPDRYSINPLDAGMRVVLPGQPGVENVYHIRVRSSSDDLTNLSAGKTSGNYQLQVRLRELDEVPGSTVRYSDIRFATNGVELLGLPAHSPITGEAAEIESVDPVTGAFSNPNDTLGQAQDVGNVAQSDRGVIGVSGELSDEDDVDFYRVIVEYDRVQPSPPNDHLAAIFDIDFSDGLGRPNTILSVFDSDGVLILTSNGSNIADDQRPPLAANGTTDLSAGSSGVQDPYIGPVELPAGPELVEDGTNDATNREVYYVAVSSNRQTPVELQQFQLANPANPLIRLEPVNSIRRIAEDRIEGFGFSETVAEPPVVPVLLDPVESVVPFTLGDVNLFVSQDVGIGNNNVTTLRYVDPFTGAVEATAGSFVEPIADIAMRGDGNLFAYTTGPNSRRGQFNDATIGTYVQINAGDASTTQLSDDGQSTNVQTRALPLAAEVAPFGNNNAGVGIIWDAITYQFNSDTQFGNGFAVGSTGDARDNDPDQVALAGTEYLENVLFHFDTGNGVIANRAPTSQDRMGTGVLGGVGTEKIEYGEILTFTRILPTNASIGDTYMLTINGESISYTVAGVPIDIGNNTVVNLGTEEEAVSGLANAWRAKALTSEAFAAYEVLNSGQFFPAVANSVVGVPDELRVRLVDPAYANTEIEWSVVEGTGGQFVTTFGTPSVSIDGAGPGGRVTGIDFVDGDMYAVTDRGGLYQVNLFGGGGFIFTGTGFVFNNNLATYVTSSAIDLMTGDNGQPIRFSGLTAGPENVANGAYADVLFGIDDDGEIFAFNTNGELQPIFVDDQTSVETNLFSANGLAFSTLDRNLWEVTGNRGNNPGHGTNGGPNADYETFDHSQGEFVDGGDSFSFSNDRDSNVGGNQRFSNDAYSNALSRTYDFPGGAHGSIITNPFSLEGYASADLPTLYFNYFLATEDTDYDPDTNPITPTRDSFRVFVSDDDGEWTLVATNNAFQDAVRLDEFDFDEGYDPSSSFFGTDGFCQYPAAAGDPCVQPLFDNTGDWRQARIPLGRFAGSEDLRLRFDFASAGEMDLGDTFTVGSELRAIPGADLRDGDALTLDGSNRLEVDLGYTVVAPNGAQIQDGDSFTVTPPSGQTITFEFDNDGGFEHGLAIQDGTAYRDGQTFTVTSGGVTETFEFNSGTSLSIPTTGAAAINDGDVVVVNGVSFEFDDDGQQAGNSNIINLVVDQGLQLPLQGGGTGGVVDGETFTISNVGGADTTFEFDDDGSLVNTNARGIDITNREMVVPIAGAGFGGIDDGDTFSVTTGGGSQPIVFEFDKDNSVAAGNRVISVTDNSSQTQVVNAIIQALISVPNLGLNPVNQGGGVIRLGVFRHAVDTNGSPSLSDRPVPATANEIADRMVSIISNSGLQLTPENGGFGLVRLGSVVHTVTLGAQSNLAVQLLNGNQDEIANLMVAAIVDAGLSLTPVNLGGGDVFLGATTSLQVLQSNTTIFTSGSVGLNDTAATAVAFNPTQSGAEIATTIASAISSTFNISAVANGDVVTLPSGVTFSSIGAAVSPAGVISVAFDAQTNSEGIARNIFDAIQGAFTPNQTTADLSVEANDQIATATDTGITGGPTLFRASGTIGDNLAFPFDAGLDVDFVEMNLLTGDQVDISASAATGSPLRPAIQLFDANGRLLQTASSNFFTQNFFMQTGTTNFTPTATINFTAVTPGTYYVAVSGGANLDYNPNFAGSADVTLNLPPQGAAVGGVTDGESISISQGFGSTPVVFEFDSNGVVAANSVAINLNDVVLQVPAAGVGPGGIQDGDTFTINNNNGSGNVTFEFDTDFNFSSNANQIFVSTLSTPQTIAFQIQSAIASVVSLGLNPIVNGTTIELNATTHAVNASGTPTLAQLTTPRTQAELLTSLRDAIRTADLGLAPQLASTTFNFFGQTQTFFTGGLSLDITNQTVDTSLAPNLSKVVPTQIGGYNLAVDIVEQFEAYHDTNRVNFPSAVSLSQSGLPSTFIDGQPGVGTGRTGIRVNSGMTSTEVAQATAKAIGRSVAGYTDQIVAVSGANIADGEIFSISDGSVTVNFEFESGYSMQIPDPIADPNALLDGEFFTIGRAGAVPINFELDNDGSVAPSNRSLRINDLIIEIPAGGVTEDLNGDGNLDVFEDLNFNGILDPTEDIDLDGVLDLVNEDRNFNGILDAGIADGNTFTIDRGPGTPTITFEYDLDGVTIFGNEVISLAPTSDETQVANATVAVLNNAGLGLDARVVGVGNQGGFGFFGSSSILIQLGITNHNVDMTPTPTINTSTTLRDQDELANLIIDVVGSAGLGLAPTYLGNGAIHLGGTAAHTLDLSNVVTITSTGLPGAADLSAEVIPVFPSDTVSAADVAQLILSAINTARVNRGLAVNAVADGARRVNLIGSNVVTDFTQAPSLPVNSAGDTVTSFKNIVNVVGHQVTTQGLFGLEEALAGDEFGAFETSGPQSSTQYPGALRGLDNSHEGVYVDDIIIGFAERGEMVIGANADSSFENSPQLFNPELPVEFDRDNNINSGAYQLEVRRAEEFGRTVADGGEEIILTRSFDTNDRLTDAVSLIAPAGHRIIEGQTITLSDGAETVTFEFDDVAFGNGVSVGNGVAATNIGIPYSVSDTDVQIARRVRDAINSSQTRALLDVTAALADGVVTGSQASPTSTESTSNVVNLFGNAVVGLPTNASATRQAAVTEPNDSTFTAIDTGIGTSGIETFIGTGAIGDNSNAGTTFQDVDYFSLDLVAGQTVAVSVDSPTGTVLSNPLLFVLGGQFQNVLAVESASTLQYTAQTAGTHFIALISSFGSIGDYEIRISTDVGFVLTEFTDFGDSNVAREQGQVLIHSNVISNSQNFGIVSDAAPRDGTGNTPHVGPPRTTREENSAGLTTGVVIANNVISRSGQGGISFTGDPNPAGEQAAAIPFGRIVNNTLVGNGNGTGVVVANNASPTLLNNIVADFATGISVDTTSAGTTIGGGVYRGNGTDAAGTTIGASAIVLSDPNDPLFVDEANGNFYLAPGTRAIDSSINSLQDRPEIVAVRGPLGYSPSPILAPDTDALGQTRVDDPTVTGSTGQGGAIFKDRGALDRADFAGPTASLIAPRDNDALGFDSDSRTTFINLTNQIVQNFSIQLLDGIEPNDPQDGTGANDASVRADRITVFRDDVKLTEGVDYKFSYDATNNIIRLTPLAGLWEIDRKYDIELSNSRGLLITAPNGTEVVDGDSFAVTDEFGSTVNLEFDSGYVLQVPQTLALQIPATGGATISDTDTISVTNTMTSVTEVFEFDLDGFTTTGNIPISFTRADSANTLAGAIVAAINSVETDLELSPVNLQNAGGRAVHLGTKSVHNVDLTNTSLTTTGQVAGVEDGQTFSIDNGEQRIIFEFSSQGELTTGDRAIPFSFSQTNEQIAQTIVQEIQTARLDLNPTYVPLSNGLINVGGQFQHVIDVSNSTLISTGTPGAATEFGLRIPTIAGALDLTTIMDGEEITVGDGTNLVTIELDNDGVVSPNDPDSHPRTVVTFNDSTTTGQLANSIAIAIRNGGVGLSPTNAGNGVIRLGGNAQHTLDLTNSSFLQLGTPGAPASIPVRFKAGTFFTAGVPTTTPIFSADEMAQSIADAIGVANASGRLRDVIATVQASDINIDGITDVIGLATFQRSDIVDIAGNPLKPNRDDGTTRFTVAIGSGVDYGDAPAPYPTKLADDGARHEVVGDFFLGDGPADVDFDGQPTDQADGDDNDGNNDENGVVFNTALVGGMGGTITVTASKTGRLDGWIDFNQDGDWNDAGEQILTSQAINGGANVLTVNVVGNALPGDTFARFRLSGSGNLRPTGPAPDGEVEDYLVTIAGNPWHNSAAPLDVDGSGFVVPLDALIVINYLNSNGPGPLVNAPGANDGMVDTNADGSASAIDVLLIVNELNNPSQSQPEGEASSVDLASSFASDIVIDQRIEIYDQRETDAAVKQARKAATRVIANNEVFGSVAAFGSVIDVEVESHRNSDDEADELNDLTLDQSWESGVDELFGDWA